MRLLIYKLMKGAQARPTKSQRGSDRPKIRVPKGKPSSDCSQHSLPGLKSVLRWQNIGKEVNFSLFHPCLSRFEHLQGPPTRVWPLLIHHDLCLDSSAALAALGNLVKAPFWLSCQDWLVAYNYVN